MDMGPGGIGPIEIRNLKKWLKNELFKKIFKKAFLQSLSLLDSVKDEYDSVKKLVHFVKNRVTRYIFVIMVLFRKTCAALDMSDQSNSKLVQICIFVR